MPSTLPNAVVWWSRISQTFRTRNESDFGSGLPSSATCDLERGGELPRLDPAGQVDLLRGRQERDLADLLQVHAHRVVRRRAQQVDLDPDLGGGVGVVAGDLDRLDADRGQVLLDLGEDVLDLLGREVVDRQGFQQVLGGDEAALPAAGHELFLDLIEVGEVAVGLSRGNAHPDSWGVFATTGTVYGTGHYGDPGAWRRRRSSPSTSTSSRKSSS